MSRKFYYAYSFVYGWTVYDRDKHLPAFDACADLLPPVKEDESGRVCVTPVCLDSEYAAMRLCLKLNHIYNERSKQHERP